MTAFQNALPGVTPEQRPLPGMKAWQPPIMTVMPDPDDDEQSPAVIPGQLSLGFQQDVLTPIGPAPQQLALIDEPLIFESADRPPAPRPQGRLARRRARLRITPGQGTLF